ncbi:pyruvate formate lyase family protein, partial [Arthrospira platensis SPKY1]|nr:pyruvate formate lyase family protein [Arthrospira platensis SPKY1]
PKILEITLNNGIDPVMGKVVSIQTGDPTGFKTYNELYNAFLQQLHHIVDLKMRVSNYIDRMFAKYAPAPFLSVVIDDCISKGRDYYDGGPRYNTSYIQCCGLGTVTDSLSALKTHVFESAAVSMDRMLKAVQNNFKGEEVLRQTIMNRTAFFGNDNDA